MKALLVVSLVSFVCGCGEMDCRDTELKGSYRIHFSEASGDCGPIEDLVTVAGSGDPDGSCAMVSEDKSENDCHLDMVVECYEVSIGADVRTIVTRELDESGEQYEDLWDLTMTDHETGDHICHSIYDVSAERI